MRSFLFLLFVSAVGWWMFGGSGYSRVVDKSPTEVAAALQDLDIRKAPGAPGTDATASGGQLPTFSVANASDRVELVVSADNQIATRMIAHLEPLDGGKKTKVWAEVVRGPAPDDHVSPAFRSTGVTMGLFSAMLEDELDKLVSPPLVWSATCDQIMARFQDRPFNPDRGDPRNLNEAFANTARTSMDLSALDQELKAARCPQNHGGESGPTASAPPPQLPTTTS